MKTYKVGTKFEICTVEYLVDVLGWWEEEGYYYHDDFVTLSISPNMMKNEGKTLTVSKSMYGHDWYGVEENNYYWPVASFLNETPGAFDAFSCDEGCIEGSTPIDGWVICKVCGVDLRKIKCLK